jgi:hypothetical protein
MLCQPAIEFYGGTVFDAAQIKKIQKTSDLQSVSDIIAIFLIFLIAPLNPHLGEVVIQEAREIAFYRFSNYLATARALIRSSM